MRLGVLTSGRQDWGILRSLCGAMPAAGIELQLLVGGMHLSKRFSPEVQPREEGFVPAAELRWLDDGGTAGAIEQTSGAVKEVGAALERLKPEGLVLVGDRFETAAAAIAATLCRVPIVHLHGGEETEGAFDNALRHAVTKLAHLHLVSHRDHAARVVAMGEEPSAVHVVGAPGLDNAHRPDLLSRAELEAQLKCPLAAPVVVVTVHPATLSATDALADVQAVVAAMDAVEATYVITLPNSDPGNEPIRRALEAAASRPRRIAVSALGDRRYWSLLKLGDALLGNSSSALIEAPLLRLPAVNVGDRQKGRTRGLNVIDAAPTSGDVTAALRMALSPAFREGLRPDTRFGDGHAAERIVSILKAWKPPKPAVKPPLRMEPPR
jgi:UDP-hydrolysing UDP-N-acetyl-D-glucosamine 2-epimerase